MTKKSAAELRFVHDLAALLMPNNEGHAAGQREYNVPAVRSSFIY